MTFECDGCVCDGCKKKYNNLKCGRCNECGWKEDGEASVCQEYYCDEIEPNK